MGKLVLVEECLVPKRLAWLKYKGPRPTDFMKDFKKTLRFVFEVSTTRCMEKKLLWDYSGDPIRIYNEWEVKKEMSRFTNMWIKFRFIGHVSKSKDEGNFDLEMYGEIKSEFSPSNWFTKYIWLFYNYLFYSKIREMYVNLCRDYINKYLNWVKEKYNLVTITTTEGSVDSFREEITEKHKKINP